MDLNDGNKDLGSGMKPPQGKCKPSRSNNGTCHPPKNSVVTKAGNNKRFKEVHQHENRLLRPGIFGEVSGNQLRLCFREIERCTFTFRDTCRQEDKERQRLIENTPVRQDPQDQCRFGHG